MNDAKLLFCDGQTINTTELADNPLDVKAIAEVGKGSQVFIEIWVDSAYTATSTTEISIDLVTSTAEPDATDIILGIVKSASGDTGGALCTTGLLAKVPIPSYGMKDHMNLSFTVGATTDPADGTISAFLTIQ